MYEIVTSLLTLHFLQEYFITLYTGFSFRERLVRRSVWEHLKT